MDSVRRAGVATTKGVRTHFFIPVSGARYAAFDAQVKSSRMSGRVSGAAFGPGHEREHDLSDLFAEVLFWAAGGAVKKVMGR